MPLLSFNGVIFLLVPVFTFFKPHNELLFSQHLLIGHFLWILICLTPELFHMEHLPSILFISSFSEGLLMENSSVFV